jgi:hypothetical protein
MSGLENAKAPESNADASGLAELKAQLAEGAGPTTYVEEDTSATDVQEEGTEAGTTAVATEEAPAETTDEAAPGAEESTEESEFGITDADRDYSDEAYQRAAAHYAKVTGVELDPNTHRKILRELMDRGQKIKELQEAAEKPAEAKAEEGADKPAEEAAAEGAKPAERKQITPQELLTQARAYAKEGIVPELAMDFAKGLVSALWPGNTKAVDAVTQEQATALMEWGRTWISVQIADALPSIMGAVPQVMGNDPVYSRVRDMATREQVVEEIEATVGPDKKPLYPDFEQLTESGAIKRVMNSPDFKAMRLHKDPVKNLVAKTKLAIASARGEAGSVAAVEKAVAKGREVERKSNAAQGAARVSPGSSKGGFDTNSGKKGFVDSLLTSRGGKFSKLINEKR